MSALLSTAEGFMMGAGLIIAIGAQNAFVLKQGIIGEHRALIAWICSISDALLITSGILGMGIVFKTYPFFTMAVAYLGALYLCWFSFKCFYSAWKGESMNIENGNGKMSLKKMILTTLALTYLNPHVYLDTVVMLGGFGASRPLELRPFFGTGAVAASFIWFFLLAYSGKFLAPLFRKKTAWRIFDTSIGFVMVYIALKLVLFGMSVKV